MAAESTGDDRRGRGGLCGYLRWVARHEPKSFCMLLGRVLPTQIAGDPDRPLRVIAEGVSPQEAAQLYADTLKHLALPSYQQMDPLMIEGTVADD